MILGDPRYYGRDAVRVGLAVLAGVIVLAVLAIIRWLAQT